MSKKTTSPNKKAATPKLTDNSNQKAVSSLKKNTSDIAASAGGRQIPLLVCLLIGLFSLALGLLSPQLIKTYQTIASSSQPAQSKNITAPSTLEETKSKISAKKTKERRMSSKHEFPCHDEALAKVLHEKPVKGMHVLCMDQSIRSLQLTIYKDAQRTENPPQVEMEGLPDWTAFKKTITEYLDLRPASDLQQQWNIYSSDGELLMQETAPYAQMDGLVQVGMVMLFQGGQFIWPGVEIGFQRTIDLYNIIPGAGPDILGKKQRKATLETLSLEPLVFSVEGFLDDYECDFFEEAAAPTMKYSEVTLMDADQGRPSSDFRTSQSTFLQKKEHPIIDDIDYRTASLVRVPRFHQEHVQVLRYGGGEKYDAHHDYFDKELYQNDEHTLKNFIQYGRRNRMITVFWYLSDVEEGGETIFPRAGGKPPPSNMSQCEEGLKVKPKRGKVIIFYSLKPDGSLDPLSLHGACPVKKGIKWAANKWVWNLPIEFGSGK